MATATKAPPKTKPSTQLPSDPRRLSEVARHVTIPAGIVTTGWPRIQRRLSDMAVSFDLWQEGISRLALGKRADGKYACTVDGITISIPRQVGKTFLVGSLIIALCLEYPGLQVVWTAHHLRTSSKTFKSMQGMVKRRKVSPHLKNIRVANGEQEIEFTNDSIVYFGARAQGFGRGFDEIDVMVFDEAQILTEKALEDMVAATNQARHPHGALLFFMGTPPRPSDPSEMFTNKRRKALKGELTNGIYVEGSADEDGDLDDPEQWRIANFSYPDRTPHESMLRLRANLPSDDAWRREGLGVWDDFESTQRPIDLATWARLATQDAPGEPAGLGIASDVDQIWLSLGASSGAVPTHLGSVLRVRADRSRAEFVAEVKRIQSERDCPVAIDPKGPAGFLVEDLEAADVDLTKASMDDFVQACADMRAATSLDQVVHGDYPDLNAAVSAAGWRTAGDRRLFARKGGDIAMLEAVSLARWAALTRESEPSAMFV